MGRTDLGGTRVEWIDVARGIGIILVVYGHSIRGVIAAGLYPETAAMRLQDGVIYGFHMPLFFLLSGLFAGRAGERGLPAFFRSRFWTIIWPYLLWSVVQEGMQLAAGGHANRSADASGLLTLLWRPLDQFWFLYALLLCQLLLVLLPRALFYAAIPVLLVVRAIAGEGNIVMLAIGDLPFFAAGVCLGAGGAERLTRGWRGAACLIGGAAMFAMVFVVPWPRDQLWQIMAVRMALGFSGIVACLGAARLIGGRGEALAALGAASMPIYLMHIIASAVVRVALAKLWPSMPPAALLACVTIAGLVLPYIGWRIAERLGWSRWLGFGSVRRPRAAPVPDRLSPTFT